MATLNLNNTLDKLRYARLVKRAARERKQRDKDGDSPPWMRHLTEPIEFITKVLRQHQGDSWYGWRVILKAAYGKPLEPDELAFFKQVAGGREPPTKRVRELWCVVGRRGGKDSTASVIAVEAARHLDQSLLRPGEDGLIPCIANTRLQARIVWKYIKGYFDTNPVLASWLSNPKMAGGIISLKNRVEIMVTTNDFRVARGFVIPAVIFDEVAFYSDEESANPDTELYNAIRPSMSTVKDAIMIGISSPHMEKGLLYDKYRNYFGKDDDSILVVQAPTRLMNPRVDELNPGEIDKAYAEDPERAAAEYGAQFRSDLADYISRTVVESLVVKDRRVLPPEPGTRYDAFCDPSGGARDSMTLGVAHRKGNKGVLDLLHEVRAPFMPNNAVAEIANILRQYGVTRISGDRYGGNTFVDLFAQHGIEYEHFDLVKSDMYRDALPLLNSGLVELLDWRDNPSVTSNRFINQICSLERRMIRGSRDRIDHPKDQHDDVANAGLGVLVKVTTTQQHESMWTADSWAA